MESNTVQMDLEHNAPRALGYLCHCTLQRYKGMDKEECSCMGRCGCHG